MEFLSRTFAAKRSKCDTEADTNSHICFCVLSNKIRIFCPWSLKPYVFVRLNLTLAVYNCCFAPSLHIHDICHCEACTDIRVWTKSMTADVLARRFSSLAHLFSFSQPTTEELVKHWPTSWPKSWRRKTSRHPASPRRRWQLGRDRN